MSPVYPVAAGKAGPTSLDCRWLMQISIGKGIAGLVSFGEHRPEILERFGMPDRRILLDDEETREEWQYNSLQTTLRFYDLEDGRIGWIQSENPHLSFQGLVLIGAPLSKVVELVVAQGYGEPELDDYESFSTHWWGDACLELQHSYAVVRQVNLGVLWKDDDSYAWPDDPKVVV